MRDAGPTDPRRWAAAPPSGVRRYLPVLTWLPAYDRTWLRFDVIAGATIWGLLVPEMIAYAGLAGLPPQAGLYTLLVTLAAYAIFGTSRHVVVAGTSAAAILVASGVADVNPSGAEEYATPGRRPGALLRRAVPRGGPSAARLHRPVPVAPGHAGLRLRARDLRHRQPAAEDLRGREERRQHDRAVRQPARRARRHERGHARSWACSPSCCCSAPSGWRRVCPAG